MTAAYIAYVVGAIVGTVLGVRLTWGMLGLFVRMIDSIVSFPGKEGGSFDQIVQLSYQTPVLLITGSGEQDSVIEEFEKRLFPSIETLVKEKGYPLFFANIEGLVGLSPLVRFLKENGAKFKGAFVIKDGDILISREAKTSAFTDEDKIYATDAIREVLDAAAHQQPSEFA